MSLPKIEYMVRVKLPSPAGYYSSPSGDLEYDEAYKKAIFDAKPPGFEVAWPKIGEHWPKDDHGRTCVLLYLSREKDALDYWIDQATQLEKKLEAIKKAIK